MYLLTLQDDVRGEEKNSYKLNYIYTFYYSIYLIYSIATLENA